MAFHSAYRLIVLVLFAAMSILIIWRPLEAHDDVWVHAAIGSWIWENQAIPNETLFLWPESIPWVYHHWLNALAFFGLASLPFDHVAIMAFTVMVGLLPVALIVWLWGARAASWAFPAVFIMSALATRIQPRPDLFTSLGIVILLLLLSRFQGPLTWRWLVGFAALFGLWANLHGAVLVGLMLLGVTLVGDAVQDGLSRRTRGLAWLLLTALAAIHLNPYGLGYWQAFASVSTYTFSLLLEWRPVWAEPYLPIEIQTGAFFSAAIALLAWLLSPQRRLSQLGWMLLGAALFFKSRRNISVFILINGMVAALNASAIEVDRLLERARQWWGEEEGGDGTSARWLIRCGVVGFLAIRIAQHVSGPPEDPPIQRLHDGAVAFIQTHGLKGRVFNDYENSAYLHWCLKGDFPLFIDTTNAYRDELQRDYFTIARGGGPAGRLITSYKINVVILTVNRSGSLATLAGNLDSDPKWSRVYAGNDAVIWVRSREFAQLIEKVGPVSPVPFTTLETYYGR